MHAYAKAEEATRQSWRVLTETGLDVFDEIPKEI
jgi:hypothetical protein